MYLMSNLFFKRIKFIFFKFLCFGIFIGVFFTYPLIFLLCFYIIGIFSSIFFQKKRSPIPIELLIGQLFLLFFIVTRYLIFTVIAFGCTSGFFGTRIFKTPFENSALIFSSSTPSGSLKLLSNS